MFFTIVSEVTGCKLFSFNHFSISLMVFGDDFSSLKKNLNIVVFYHDYTQMAKLVARATLRAL